MKEERDFKIEYQLNWDYDMPISELRKDLDAIEKLGATHIEINHGVSYDCSYLDIYPFVRRMETDDEFKERIEEFNKRKQQHELMELQEYKRLKEKYGE